jgi:hypothetical protein
MSELSSFLNEVTMYQASILKCLPMQVDPSHWRKLAPVFAAVGGGGKRETDRGRGLHTLVSVSWTFLIRTVLRGGPSGSSKYRSVQNT